ncbi:MAG: DUF4230 domain-containing protein [Candidatus Viridilinea halotolerans]|uniref:DUF4230 domain-containing protein n=1 Tax=Candidatus Viridilinea halotolerans TaxID=2491704 RepID=A0A426U6X4_9CHLR|nr:MAG: DUF4230 domain-containing protein [Candidatus Viridilinea halotolerans]
MAKRNNDDTQSENLMQRRLRKARGEEIDDDLEHYGYDDYDERPRNFGGAAPPPRRAARGGGGGGGGCSQVSMVLAATVLALLIAFVFLVNSTLGGVGQLFGGVPNLREIIVTPTPQIITGAAVIERVNELSRLETSSYTIQTVIDVQQSQGNPIFDFFAGDALLLIAKGTVIAGVDMGALSEADVTVGPDGRTLTLRLPPAQIFSTMLDNEATRVYDRERAIFAPENPHLETLARQQAERQILQAACEDGILGKATDQAVQSLNQFLGLLDGIEVTIVPSSPDLATCP